MMKFRRLDFIILHSSFILCPVWFGLVPVGRITDTGPAAPSATAVPVALAMLSLGAVEEFICQFTALLVPASYSSWQPALFDALAARAAETLDIDAVVPQFEGKRGHPILLSPESQIFRIVLPPISLQHKCMWAFIT